MCSSFLILLITSIVCATTTSSTTYVYDRFTPTTSTATETSDYEDGEEDVEESLASDTPKFITSYGRSCLDVHNGLINVDRFEVRELSEDISLMDASISVREEIDQLSLNLTLWECEENPLDFYYECYHNIAVHIDDICRLPKKLNIFKSCPIQRGVYRIEHAPVVLSSPISSDGLSKYWRVKVDAFSYGEKVACLTAKWGTDGKWTEDTENNFV